MDNYVENSFLYCLKESLRGGSVSPDFYYDIRDKYCNNNGDSFQLWDKVFSLSDQHLLLPMHYEASYRIVKEDISYEKCCSETILIEKKKNIRKWERRAFRQVKSQYERTAAFLDLYDHLLGKGLMLLVVKGFVCRQTYPNPEYRQSWDEDLLVRPDEFDACHEALLRYGMQLESSEEEVKSSYEVIYRDLTTGLIIEVHKSLFPDDSAAYGDLNRYFYDAFERAVPLTVDEDTVWTMDPDRHFFYLICHTFKHFLHFGAGMRQLTDILMYARSYGNRISWDEIWNSCREIRAERFVAGIFAIGEKYLGIRAEETGIPEAWIAQAVDIDILLRDVLDAGMQAQTSLSRIHSSSVTLNAVASRKEGKEAYTSVWKNLFPPFSSMASRYPYLNRLQLLLPIAWGQRILHYALDTIGEGEKNSASETLRIGNERIKLFRSQGILDEPSDDLDNQSGNKPDGINKLLHAWSRIKISPKKPGAQKGNKRTEGKKKDDSHSEISNLLKRAGNTTLGGKAVPFASKLWKGIFFTQWVGLQSGWTLSGYRMPGPKERDAVRKHVTFIYKSFERKEMAVGLYKNIQKFYPGVQVIIADDSKIPLEFSAPYLKIIHLPFNSGLSRGISAALQEVRTPYVMRMDDDELLTRRTNVGKQLLFLADHPEVDIVTFGFITIMNHHPEKAVWPTYYNTTMSDAPKKLKIRHMTRIDETHVVLGKGPNIYLARTESIRKVGYDENIRMIDHHEFFYRASGVLVTVGALDSFVFHRHNPFDPEYQKYRSDLSHDEEYLRKKYAGLR